MLWKVQQPEMTLKKFDRSDEILIREAFGDSSFRPARGKALKIINSLRENSQWIMCDCRSRDDHPPYLIPVKNQGIRRVEQFPHVADKCEFQRDSDAPAEVRASLAAPPTPAPGELRRISLADPFGEDDALIAAVNERQSTSLTRRQPRLARLIRELLLLAGDNMLGENDDIPTAKAAKEQREKISEHAKSIRIANNQTLSDWLRFGESGLQQLIRRLERENPRGWAGARPHGIVIFTAAEIVGTEIRFSKDGGGSVRVRGQMSVFGERDGVNRKRYVVVGLVARSTRESKPDLLRAYAHPCLNYAKWALIDSNLERVTFSLIDGVRKQLQETYGFTISVEKPLFDIMPAEFPENTPVTIPDFILSRSGGNLPPARLFVETMGYNDDRYRYRKEALKDRLEQVRSNERNVQVVAHDRFGHPNKVAGDNHFAECLTKALLS